MERAVYVCESREQIWNFGRSKYEFNFLEHLIITNALDTIKIRVMIERLRCEKNIEPYYYRAKYYGDESQTALGNVVRFVMFVLVPAVSSGLMMMFEKLQITRC